MRLFQMAGQCWNLAFSADFSRRLCSFSSHFLLSKRKMEKFCQLNWETIVGKTATVDEKKMKGGKSLYS